MIERVMFVSRNAVENISGNWKQFALISISEPHAVGQNRIDERLFFQASYYHFHDVLPGREYGEPFVVMDAEHAKRLVAFVHFVAPNITGILINCQAGISRSAGVAKWVCEAHGLPFNRHYKSYNQHVFALLQQAQALYIKQ